MEYVESAGLWELWRNDYELKVDESDVMVYLRRF